MNFTTDDIKRVVWTFLMAGGAAFLLLAPGILGAPNLQEAKAAGIAALIACLAAGFSAVKNLLLNPGDTLK